MNEFWQYIIIFLLLFLIGGKEIAVPFLKKKGWLNGNGEYKREWSESKFKIIDDKLELLEVNHFSHLEERMDKMIEKQDEQILISKEILLVIKNKHE